jgi:hypothetical protein
MCNNCIYIYIYVYVYVCILRLALKKYFGTTIKGVLSDKLTRTNKSHPTTKFINEGKELRKNPP